MGIDSYTLKEYKIANFLFYCLFFCEFNYRFLTSTMIYPEYVASYSDMIVRVYDALFYVLLGLTVFSIFFEFKNPKTKVFPVCLLVIVLLYNHVREITTLKTDAVFIMLLICSKNKSYKIIGAISLICGWLWITASAVACKLGYIPDIVFGDRHSFGSVYTTDLACHFLTLFIVLCILKNGQLKIYDYLFGCALLLINLSQMKAKIGFAGLFLVVIGTFFYQYILPRININHGATNVVKFICVSYILFVVPAVIYWTVTYSDNPENFYNKYHILSTLQSRFMLGKIAFEEYPINLWGSFIREKGNGGNTTGVVITDYFFLDISFIRLLFHKGIVILSAIIAIFVKIQARLIKDRNYYVAFLVLVFLIDCTIEHHIMEASYSLLVYLLFCAPLSFQKDQQLSYIAVNN